MSALPDSLGKVRREAVDALQSRLNAMCDGADDALFDLSQKAPAEEQSLYFDAMRELRVQRQAIVDSFRAAVDRDFAALEGAGTEGRKAAQQVYTLDSLTLLGDEELDVSVAFQGMVARIRDMLATDLDHLRQRFSKVLAREIEAEHLPLHPAKICEHFAKATDALKVPIKARLILYKLFERKVLDELHDIVAVANHALAVAGVLPEIKSAKARPSADTGRGRGGAAGKAKRSSRDEDDDEDDDGEPARGRGDMSGAFAELLALARGAMMPGGFGGGGFAGGAPGGGMPGGFAAGGFPGAVPGAGGTMMIPVSQLPAGQVPVMYNGQAMVGGMVVQSDVPLQVVAPAELTALLTRLQQMQPVAVPAEVEGEGGRIIEHIDAVDVKGGLSELMRDETSHMPRALTGADDDVINLVSMLFDFILDDAELPSEIKALVSRLQIPLLKVSLLDKSLFSEEDHAARRLVNGLAKAGVGWTRESDDGLYRKIEEAVFRVLNEFTDDVSLFERLADDFAAFVAEREKRMSLIEGRLRDREEGQAKAEVAQKLVRDAIAARIAGRALPSEVLAIIQDAWQRVLYMTAIREGADSALWQQRTKVLEVLVWCAQRYEKPDLRERQRGLVSRLIVSLRKGFEAVGFDASRGEVMLAALNAQLQQLVGGERPRTVRVVAEARPATTTEAKPAGAAASEGMQVLRRTEDEVVIATSPEPVPASETPPLDERWMQMADNLPPGTWVEFSEQDFKVRGKIAARIRAHGKYVFVNGRGVKIFEKTISQLAIDLQAGIARLVNDTAIFDRALENMISQLKTGQAVAG